MSDEDLEVLITLDDPWYGPDDDVFHHLQPVTHWPGQPFPMMADAGLEQMVKGTSRAAKSLR